MTEPTPSAEVSASRRPAGAWHSFLATQGALGGNLFVALGLVVLTARGTSALAFGLAGLVFLLVGLAYIEMLAAFPVAGGGQYFVLRGLGDFWGFVAGSALILDLTIGVALFAAVSSSYANTFAPTLLGIGAEALWVDLGGLGRLDWFWFAESAAIAALLVVVNSRGLKEKTGFSAVVGSVALAVLTVMIVGGLLFAWTPEAFMRVWSGERPGAAGFCYGLSLAVICFVGLQAIALVAADSSRPGRTLPRPMLALMLTTVLFAVALGVLAPGSVGTAAFGHGEAPLAPLAGRLPVFGTVMTGLVAAAACLVLLVSADTFVTAAARLAFSMGQYDALGEWARRIHPKLHTPFQSILILGAVVLAELGLAFLWPGQKPLEILANMYAFGATTAYTLLMVAAIRLRHSEPGLTRPFLVPWNVGGGRSHRGPGVSLLMILGLVGSAVLLALVLATHEIGRVAGPAWMTVTLIYYFLLRGSRGLPLFGSRPRDWHGEQLRILLAAGEGGPVSRHRATGGGRGGNPEP